METDKYVWIVGLMDYGDNGWSVVRVFESREEADTYVAGADAHGGYFQIEKHVVGDKDGDFYASQMWEGDR